MAIISATVQHGQGRSAEVQHGSRRHSTLPRFYAEDAENAVRLARAYVFDGGKANYVDRLSLYFCMRDVENGESSEIGDYRLAPLGPWRVTGAALDVVLLLA